MIFKNRIRIANVITLIGAISIAVQADATENIKSSTHRSALKTLATGCQPAVSAIDLDINNVQARLMTGGDMWWNIGTQNASYVIPKNSGRSSQFAASCWIGGKDETGQLKVAAQTYRQDGNDYWPGAVTNDGQGKITADVCSNWDKFWKVDKSTINEFIQAYKSGGANATKGSQFDVINQWPARGNDKAMGSTGLLRDQVASADYAPFVDLNNNGKYEPDLGDYPLINGDEYIWWVFNDAGNVKEQSQTNPIGIEVQTSAFAYSTQDFLNNATFCNYRVINKGPLVVDSTYIAVWDDCDLGYAFDDFIGCDTTRGLGIQYNGTNDDGLAGGHPPNSYGLNPPQVGLDFFQGPKKTVHRTGLADTVITLPMTVFDYYNNDFSVIGNPRNGVQIYYYMTGSITTGQRFSDDFQGPGLSSKGYGSGPVSNFVFFGDPGDGTTWSECTCNNTPGDRRFIFSSGPFTLEKGAKNDITFGCIWAPGVGGCPNTNFNTIKGIDDQAQALFDEGFKTTEGPNAPRMEVRELDRRLVFYLVNDYGSNNFGENYGRADGTYADSLQYHQIVPKAISPSVHSSDSLYKFEGYRVFQLANGQISASDIFDPTTGQVDPTKAIEVFQCDIHNGVTTIINYSKQTNISDTTWLPQIKVSGKDSGLRHSFEVTQDQFSTTSDKSLVNYKSYYYVAVAYAYNQFAPFNPGNHQDGVTQDVPYIGSAHGAGGINIPVVVGLPNPANGAMGTVINSDYGSGVIVHRIEGTGNGGNILQLDAASDSVALFGSTNIAAEAIYQSGSAPINIKVVDPVKVPSLDWVLQITGPNTANGIDSNAGGWSLVGINGSNPSDTIYNETSVGTINEQILEKYGLSVTIGQVATAGVHQDDGNGYITSDITFTDQSQPWLWGVPDQADSNAFNWLRSGNNQAYTHPSPCNYNDYSKLDTAQAYETLLSNFTPAKSTWGPYDLAAAWFNKHTGTTSDCGFEVAYSGATQNQSTFNMLSSVDVVFTSDISRWTRAAVIEMQDDPALAQGGAAKFTLRKHLSWDSPLDYDSNGNPIYSTTDSNMSWFPGYAINEETGERLNIVFGEDSWLQYDNGGDMLWNPSPNFLNQFDGSILFGGKHFVYILGTRYDKDSAFVALQKGATATNANLQNAYKPCQWVGLPILNPSLKLLSLKDHLIPTETRLRFRVTRPYAPYVAVDTTSLTNYTSSPVSNPYYKFSTKDLAATPLSDSSNRNALLDRIYAVPNPYYGYSGYETSRFSTTVRIINLPARAEVYIYSLDGSLIRTLSKNDPNTSYLDWDIRNTAGLSIASGMYLMDVKAEGIGETVVKWFGAMRPIDISTY